MATALNLKRKNIDLPVETLQKLSLMAVAQGKSLKNFIETILITKADSIKIEIAENPSPSNDSWFKDADNIADLDESIRQHKEGKTRAFTMDEIKDILGV